MTTKFGLAIPADARQVRFFSDSLPFGDGLRLILSFSTTPVGLKSFLKDVAMYPSHDEPEPPEGRPGCGLAMRDFHAPSLYSAGADADVHVAAAREGPNRHVLFEGHQPL